VWRRLRNARRGTPPGARPPPRLDAACPSLAVSGPGSPGPVTLPARPLALAMAVLAVAWSWVWLPVYPQLWLPVTPAGRQALAAARELIPTGVEVMPSSAISGRLAERIAIYVSMAFPFRLPVEVLRAANQPGFSARERGHPGNDGPSGRPLLTSCRGKPASGGSAGSRSKEPIRKFSPAPRAAWPHGRSTHQRVRRPPPGRPLLGGCRVMADLASSCGATIGTRNETAGKVHRHGAIEGDRAAFDRGVGATNRRSAGH
jgi:hypothetical protein